MKTIKILVLVSILAVTQSFALSKTQKKILFGLGAGAIIVHAINSHNHHRYDNPRVVYVDSRHSHRKHKRHHRRKHHRYGHDYYSRANHHDRHYYRNGHRHPSWDERKHRSRAHDRY